MKIGWRLAYSAVCRAAQNFADRDDYQRAND
jgi:hypothetical protein